MIQCSLLQLSDSIAAVIGGVDHSLFSLLNIHLRCAFLDYIMPVITEKDNWWPLIAAVALLMAIPGGKRGRIALLAVILAITASDQLSSSLMKPLFGRVRPCHVVPGVQILVKCSKSPSFPSSHAANMAAFATVITFFFRKWAIPAVIIALAVAYSRIYVGVHYPLDVLGGLAVGILSAGVCLQIVRRVVRRISPLRNDTTGIESPE